MDSIRKELKNFLKKHKNILIEKPFASFICGVNEIEGIKQVNSAFPSETLNHSVVTAFLRLKQ